MKKMSKVILASQVCLGMVVVLGILGALALFSLSIVDSLGVNYSGLPGLYDHDFCTTTSR